MVMNFTNSEIGSAASTEQRGIGLVSRIRAFLSHIGTLLTEAPDRYKKVPNAQEYAQMSTNKGCGSGGGNGETLTEMERKAAEEAEKQKQYMRDQRFKGRYYPDPHNGNN